MNLRLDAPALRIQTLKKQPSDWAQTVMRHGDARDYTFLDHCLEPLDRDARTALVAEALGKAEPGGTVVAWDHCCDSGAELWALLDKAGPLPPIRQLTNADIAALKPQGAVYLKDVWTFKGAARKVLWDDFRRRYPSVPDEFLSDVPEKFVTNVLRVGMMWVKGS